jgi:hypothetical protein
MKRPLLVIVLIVLLSGLMCVAALGQTGNGSSQQTSSTGQFSDVPKDHWAYEDLMYLAERGIITGLPGGTYNGSDPLNRYSAAALIARAVRYLQNNAGGVTQEDLDVLKDLIVKVSDNLSVLQDQVAAGPGSELEGQVAQNEQDIANLSSQMSGTDTTKLARQVNTTFVIAVTGLLVGIVAVVLPMMNL